MKKYISFILILFFILACNSTRKINTNEVNSEKKATELNFSVVLTGEHSQMKEKQYYIFRSKDELYKFFKSDNTEELFKNADDFKRNMLIGIFLGQQSTGGINIKIDAVTENEESVVVKYHIEYSKIAMMVMTAPYAIIKIKKTDKKIVFEENKS